MNTQIGNFENESDIDTWLLSEEFHPIDYFTLIKHSPYIFTPFVTETLRRYKLLKEYGIYSYGRDFETQPAWWVDMLMLIDSEIQKAMKEHGKLKR